jgi:hypothetical protein
MAIVTMILAPAKKMGATRKIGATRKMTVQVVAKRRVKERKKTQVVKTKLTRRLYFNGKGNRATNQI